MPSAWASRSTTCNPSIPTNSPRALTGAEDKAPPAADSEIVVGLRRLTGKPRLRVEAPGRVDIDRLVLGKAPEAAARRSGRAYSACSEAQEGAARAALGLAPKPDAGRRIARESLRDHAEKLAVIWPKTLGMAPDRHAAEAAAALDEDGGADGGMALSAALFGAGGAPRRIDEFEDWMAAGETAAARSFAHVWNRWDSRWARAALPLWRIGAPLYDIDWFEADINGGAVDASVCARVAYDDLMREICVRRGRGLPWRMAARLVDAVRLLDDWRHGSPQEVPETLGEGLGAANAARGVILVRAETRDGVVVEFDRLGPTDFALRPGGVLDKAMETLPVRSRGPVERVATLTMETIDPCAPHRLEFEA
jgi:hypothetical protein